MPKPLILCIDAEQNTLDLLSNALTTAGYLVRTARVGANALTAGDTPDLVILDLTLPDISGFDLIKSIRAVSTVPILVLTAVDTDVEVVLAFELGADDYVVKPFGVRELTSRVKAILRRCSGVNPSDLIRVGPLTIDSENYEAYCNGEKMVLTLKEYELLKMLASSPGKVLTRDFLLDRIWGYEFSGETRTVDVHIRHIRQKLGDDATMIETVRGVGYKLKASA